MIIPVYPQKVIFKFQTRWCNSLPSDAIPSIYTLTVQPTQSGVNLGTLSFDEECLALFTYSESSTVPTNNDKLQSLINQFVLDLFNWQQYQFDEVFAGIAAVQQNGILQCTEFSYNRDSCFTRVSSFPNSFTPSRLAHQITTLAADCPASDDSNSATPCIKMYGPPTDQSSGSTTLSEFLVCLQDGRLTEKYIGEYTYDCGCQQNECCLMQCNNCELDTSKNMTLSWVNNLIGNGSTTLYFQTSTNSWQSNCSNGLLYQVICNQNQIEFRAVYFSSSICPTGTQQYCSTLRNAPFGLNVTSFSCSPSFEMVAEPTLLSCSAISSSGFTQFTITAPSIGPRSHCCSTFCVYACEGASQDAPVVGATVSISTPQGQFVTSGLTGSTGCVLLDVGESGLYQISVSGPNIPSVQYSINVQCCTLYALPTECLTYISVYDPCIDSVVIGGITVEITCDSITNTYVFPTQVPNNIGVCIPQSGSSCSVTLTYQIQPVLSPYPRFLPYTFYQTFLCGGLTSVTPPLNPCLACNACCDANSLDLFLTDSNGTYLLNLTSNLMWSYCYTLPGTGYKFESGNCIPNQDINIGVYYEIQCVNNELGPNTFYARRQYSIHIIYSPTQILGYYDDNCENIPPPPNCSTGICQINGVASSIDCCEDFMVTISLTTPACTFGTYPDPVGGDIVLSQ